MIAILMFLLMIVNLLIAEINLHGDKKFQRYAGAFSYFAAGVCFLSGIYNLF